MVPSKQFSSVLPVLLLASCVSTGAVTRSAGGNAAVTSDEEPILQAAERVQGAAVSNLDPDPARTRIEGVLDELLHDGRRALDDLSSRNLVDQGFRKNSNELGPFLHTTCGLRGTLQFLPFLLLAGLRWVGGPVAS